jgi:pre-rRNA-processing protein TSR3
MKPTIILRHRKENLKKCSLKGLETRSDLIFLTYPQDILPNLSSYILLTLNAPTLTIDDQEKGLFLVDATWRYADLIIKSLPNIEKRSLPSHFKTAYPRKQTSCSNPEVGLASIEALFLAHLITNKNTENLLSIYYWKEDFLLKNKLDPKII